jgi:hypothetical protein
MTTILWPHSSAPSKFSLGRTSDEVSRRIQRVLWHNRTNIPRNEQRYPFPYPIYLSPATVAGPIPDGGSITVFGKDLSDRGLGFYHTEPLAEKYVVASIDCGAAEAKFLLELTWCRFCRSGLFENGGRFLKVLG